MGLDMAAAAGVAGIGGSTEAGTEAGGDDTGEAEGDAAFFQLPAPNP